MATAQASKDSASLADFFSVLRLRKALIALILALVLVTTLAVTAFLPKWYLATTKVRVEKPEGAVQLYSVQGGGAADPYFLQDQFKIMQSEKILYPVIDHLNLGARLAPLLGSTAALPKSVTFHYLVDKMLRVAAEHFRHVILDGRAFKAEVGRFTSAPDLARRLAGDSRAIAVAAAPPADSSAVKILAVARRADQAAHLPKVENFRSGKYPLGVPVRIIVRRDAVGRLRPLLRFLLSDEAAVALGQAELLAESADFRREQVRRLEEM